MRHILAAALLVGSCLAIVAAQPAPPAEGPADVDPAKLGDIHRLLEVSGTSAAQMQAIDEMIKSMQDMPGLPPGFWEAFREEIKPQDLLDAVIPVYDRHFTHPEIRELIAFYESPIGRKFVEKQPLVLQEGMAAGQAVGQQAAARAVAKLLADQPQPAPTPGNPAAPF